MKTLADYFHFSGARMRIVRDEDIRQLVSIINEAYSYQDEAKGEPRTNPEHLRKRISETQFYVVESGQRLIGCVFLEPNGKSLQFGLLTVVPDFRGKGVAVAVVRAIEGYSRENGYRDIELHYMSLAPWLKRYYEKYGFVETGEVTEWGSINLIKMRKTT